MTQSVNIEDPRVQRTRFAIREAFERLLETTDYTDITVSALAREAGISRKTFYAHYSSVDALLRQIVRDMLDSVVAEIEPEGTVHSPEHWTLEFSRALLHSMRDNSQLNSNVASCLPAAEMLGLAREPLLEICKREARLRGLPDVEGIEYYFSYYLGGLFSVYEAWETSGKGPEELELAAELIGKASAYGFAKIVEK